MSGYIVDDGETIEIIENGKTSTKWWLLYSDRQRKRKQKVFIQMTNIWLEVERLMLFYIQHNVETNSLMERVCGIFFLTLRNTKNQNNDINLKNISRKNKLKKLNKMRNRKEII